MDHPTEKTGSEGVDTTQRAGLPPIKLKTYADGVGEKLFSEYRKNTHFYGKGQVQLTRTLFHLTKVQTLWAYYNLSVENFH